MAKDATAKKRAAGEPIEGRVESEAAHQPGKGSNAVGILYVVLSAVCFALAGVLIKVVDWNALSISGARSVFAIAVLYAFLRVKGGRLTVNAPTLAGAAVNFIMMQTFVIANKLTTAANTIVLQFTEPIWLILIMWLVFRERPRRAALAACAVIFGGVVFFFFDQLSPAGLWGNVIAIVSGIAYAGVFLMKRIPRCDFESAAIISFAGCFACGIPTLMSEADFSPGSITAIVVLGVVQIGLAYVFLSKGLDLVSPVTASLTSMVEPVLNPVLAAIFIGEAIGPFSLVGAALVIGGAAAYNVYEARHALPSD